MPALFILDATLVLAFAYFLAAALRPPTRPAFLISVFILVWGELVFTVEILSLFYLVTAAGLFAAHAFLALGAFLWWRAEGRPRHPRLTLPPVADMIQSAKSSPDLWILGLVVGLAYILLALINILVPPNNPDSYVYHLTKVAYWIQHKTLAPWPTPCLHQTLFPLNAEIGSLWSMVFLRSDLLAGFVQWFSALASMTSVFGLARGFGSSRAQAALASGLYLSLPMIVLQSTTTQNDLTAAALTTAMAFLLLLGLRTKHHGMLILSGAALGLVLGTKLTAFMIIPGFVIGLAFVSLVRKPRPIRLLLVWAGACLAGFIVLGAFNYVQDWLYLKHGAPISRELPKSTVRSPQNNPPPLEKTKPKSTVRSPQNDPPPLKKTKPEALSIGDLQVNWRLGIDPTLVRFNLARDIFSFLDLTGVPQPLVGLMARARAAAGRERLSLLLVPKGNIRATTYTVSYDFQDSPPLASEATSFFGPLGFFLWLPLVLYWSLAGLIKRDSRLIPALSFLGFMLLLAGSQLWIPFRGRYYCLAMALSAPLTAVLYGRGRLRAVVRGLVVLIALAVMTGTILTNDQKPLVGPRAIWGKTRQERRAVLWTAFVIPGQIIYEFMPRRGKVATILRSSEPEYILFGENLSRTLTPIFPPPDIIDRAWLQKNLYDAVVVNSNKISRVAALPPEEFKVYKHFPYTVIVRVK